MTTVIVAPRVENPLTSTEDVPDNGGVRVRLSKRTEVNNQWITDAWSKEKKFTGTAINFDLDPVAGVPYEIWIQFRDGAGEKYEIREFRIITDQGSPTRWETFELRAAPGQELPLPSNLEARVAVLEAAVPSGPATNVVNVSGISAYARNYLDDTSQAATQATLDVPSNAAAVHMTGAETIAGVKTFSSSPIVPTPTTSGQAAPKSYVDSQTGVAPAWSAITGKPSTFAPTVPIAQSDVTGLSTLASTVATHTSQIAGLSSPFIRETSPGVYPNRDVTAAGVMRIYVGSAPPTKGGTVSSGTYAVDNLDGWWKTS